MAAIRKEVRLCCGIQIENAGHDLLFLDSTNIGLGRLAFEPDPSCPTSCVDAGGALPVMLSADKECPERVSVQVTWEKLAAMVKN
jgi:hypothetical protein